MRMVLEARRVFLRNWCESDVTHYMTLANDVGYNCFSTPGRFLVRTEGEARRKVAERMNLFDAQSLGKFPIFLKETGEFVGTCGMEPFEMDGGREVELGYRLCLKHWGKGYASESAVAVLRYGFGDLQLPTIVAFALRQNSASIRVLEKLGAHYVRDFVHSDLSHRLYKIPRDRFVS